MLAPAKDTPKKAPTTRKASTEMEVKRKRHTEEERMMVVSEVGVDIMASRVPIICSSRTLSAKEPSPVRRYMAIAIPTRTKEK